MLKKSEHQVSKIFLVMFVLLAVATTPSFSRIVFNYFGTAYGESDVGEKSSSAIEALVTEGAGYFLKSYSDYLLFLNKIELWESQTDGYFELQDILNRSIVNMENAKKAYDGLVKLAEVTPYNRKVIGRLQNFDYANFVTKNGLSGIIFEDLEKYFKKGDVTGSGKMIYSKCTSILDLFYSLKNEYIDVERFPDLKICWTIQQHYAQSLLFGQYVAEILYGIKEKI